MRNEAARSLPASSAPAAVVGPPLADLTAMIDRMTAELDHIASVDLAGLSDLELMDHLGEYTHLKSELKMLEALVLEDLSAKLRKRAAVSADRRAA